MSPPIIIDRRKNPGKKNLSNRQRFIDRFRDKVKEAARKHIGDRRITDGGDQEISISGRGTDEPEFVYSRDDGDWDYVVPGNREYVPGDTIDKPSGGSTTGSKIELAAWARCNASVANILVDGYYMAASEIERRLQICSSNFYADPGRMPKQGWYQRFLRWATSNDLTPPPSDEALEVALKQSTPLESKQDTAGLMKCEWMFSRSRSPVIDVLPGGSPADGSSAPAAVAPVKKTAPKKPASKQP